MQAFNRVRMKVWRQQPDEFFDVAILEADGTMVETCGEKKQGIGMNYKKQWGYHPLVVTLANTGEPLYVVNRSGNRPSHEQAPFRQIVFAANDRCDQENTISQLKACGALAAPLGGLLSNWAYMVIASLAWSLKIWSGLVIRPRGSRQQKQQQAETKRRVIRMDFHTFRQCLIQIPAQIIRRSRRLIYRLLSYRQSMEPLLLIHDNLRRPLRC